MTVKKQSVLAQEAMQEDVKFFEDLTEAIGKLRKTGMSKTDCTKSGIAKLVKDRTKLNINFFVDMNVGINAYMMPPDIDRNHPFWAAQGYTFDIDGKDRKHIAKKGIPKGNAITNDANYTVGGIWENVPVDLAMGKGLMKSTFFTDAGVAAIFLHELGHVYTFFSLLGKLSRKNLLVSEGIKDIMQSANLEERVQTITFVGNKLNINFKNPEEIAQSNDQIRPDLLESIIIAEEVVRPPSTSSTEFYDTRNVEQIADQFAVFHGAGAELAVAMTELYRISGAVEAMSGPVFVAIEILKVMMFGYILTASPLVGIFLLLLGIPSGKVYDDPGARIELIRKQLVGQIRNHRGDPMMVKRIQDQIATMDTIETKLKDRRTFYQTVFQTITPRGRTMYRQEIFMKSIENLLYSDTYLNAVKFGALVK